jgi:cytochrome c
MKILRFNKYFLLFITAVVLFSCSGKKVETRILVFTKTLGWRHSSIPDGIKALEKMAKEHDLLMDTTENADNFNEENLRNYKAVIFLNTSGDVLNKEQQNDFERFIQAGGGFVGVHAATDTEYGWPWYGKLAGAYFKNHPNNPNVRSGTYRITDHHHPASDSLPDEWKREDEFYNFKMIDPDIKVIVKIDEKSYEGGENGEKHPMSWYHEFDGGRAFYTSMGHTEETYSEPLFLKHLWGGLYYALGEDEPKALNYELAHTKRVPDENRFTITELARSLDEPMELVVLNDSKVLFIERKGNIKLYNPATGRTKIIATIPVSTTYNLKDGKRQEAEDGLLGVAMDPDFEKNHWIYLYYSPAGNDPKNILTRYEFFADSLITSSKKVILEVPVQRDECCHTGGSIAFDKNRNLYISTGDNTSPRATYYGPIDERPDRSPWDAQKSSSNTNDLRGKIIRIHPEADGTYTIPEDNLFTKGTGKTRPEIYVMGVRNPFRITVDKNTGFLYWGDVGPDAAKPDSIKGPAGFDEFNQARKAGFFGWPYFVGNNQAYSEFDFTMEKAGGKFDQLHPVNNSPNNTGLNDLPPAYGAYIWYPYDVSEEFQEVGYGGRTAMAGPVFHSEDFKKSARPFPDYYDGRLFIYEWMRGWIMTVTMDKDGNYKEMEHFMPNHRFTTPIDMAFGIDGDLYLLEYGTGWFQGNDNARLIKIEYNAGNRKPQLTMMADKSAGAIPLTVNFSSKGTIDFDRDELKYEWKILSPGLEELAVFNKEDIKYTFEKPGIYKAILTVKDGKNESTSRELEICAGNDAPRINFEITEGNKYFYFPGASVKYKVNVNDREDGSLDGGQIFPEQISVTIDELAEGFDQVHLEQGHKMSDENSRFATGKKLISESDCKSCHAIDKKSIGPAYISVAEKYKEKTGIVEKLSDKVIKGGSGVWGEVSMAAHSQLSKENASEMIRYILSLADEKKSKPQLPPTGTYTFNLPSGLEASGGYLFRASYTDKGANSLPALTSEEVFILRKPIILATSAEYSHGIQKLKQPDSPVELVLAATPGAYIGFKKLDLSNIDEIIFITGATKRRIFGAKIEVHLDSPKGKLIGESTEILFIEGQPTQYAKADILETSGLHNVYFVFRNDHIIPGKILAVIQDIQFHAKKNKVLGLK